MKWINIAKQKPLNGTNILIYDKDGDFGIWYEYQNEDGENDNFEVTHWMPIPEPPKDNE